MSGIDTGNGVAVQLEDLGTKIEHKLNIGESDPLDAARVFDGNNEDTKGKVNKIV